MIARKHATGPPLALLALILLLGLAAVGVGYGLWAKTLTIEGRVETGEVDAKWLTAFCREFHTWPDLPASSDGWDEAEGKEVGDTTFYIDPTDGIMHVLVTNGYPSYAVDCEVTLRVEGSIPVILRGIRIRPVSSNLQGCVFTAGLPNRLECDEITVIFSDGVGLQYHPGNWKSGSLLFHVEQEAEQLDEYEFAVDVCFAQWNEGATAEECFAEAP